MMSRDQRDGFLAWELGLAGDSLDHYVSGAEWQLPHAIDLDGDCLIWKHGDEDEERPTRVHSGPGLLEEFVTLDRAPDAAILRYARRWGPLWLCEHGWPWIHGFGRGATPCLPRRRPGTDWLWEPLGDWRDLARQSRAVLRIARRLHGGQPADENERSVFDFSDSDRLLAFLVPTIGSELPDGDDIGRHWTVSTDRQERMLAFILERWLACGRVQPSMYWKHGKATVRLYGLGLFGALAVQLLFDACRTDGLAVCTSCGTPYLPPSRRPRWDRNAYCPDCGRRAQQRDASARYRRTLKY